MKAVTFDVSIGKYVATTLLGKVNRDLQHGPLSCVGYGDVHEPRLPGPDWVKVRTRYGGICGSDLNLVYLHDTPTLSPFVSERFVIGHENTGVIVETGGNAGDFRVGDRVVADAMLPCEARGIDKCPQCAAGNTNTCLNFDKGAISPGTLMGTCGTTGGSWGEYFVAHKSQLFRVPDNVSDEDACLIDPLCSALHPVLRNFPKDDENVLVLGTGIIGLMVLAVLRAFGSKARVTVIARHGFQGDMAKRHGADHVVGHRDKAALLGEMAGITDARIIKPMLGDSYLMGGFDTIYDCVGSEGSLKDSMGLANTGGKVVVIGLAGIVKMDWSLLWFKELTLRGMYVYGSDPVPGVALPQRTYATGLGLLSDGRIDTTGLVTHRFPLRDYRQAIRVASSKSRYRSIKVLLEP